MLDLTTAIMVLIILTLGCGCLGVLGYFAVMGSLPAPLVLLRGMSGVFIVLVIAFLMV